MVKVQERVRKFLSSNLKKVLQHFGVPEIFQVLDNIKFKKTKQIAIKKLLKYRRESENF